MASRPPVHRGPADDRLARNRWAVMQFTRFAGFALVILGILLVRGIVHLDEGADRYMGYAFIVIGLVDGFVVPQVLARKWRSPPQ
ncbi:hypothetical protein GCM10011515_18470 [Tsuneonella deserti]|uniref:Uncharacterized protein n=1 Tax=Tsuneonella deserti TaxID=2035528 RepID=A0ABQ1SAM4_9SPHN|nr:hypothetical protein [Tsuneonella deserti]GGD98941.1 hypothetical protein GCM10011515_18470 [Tsuneonella deserti]